MRKIDHLELDGHALRTFLTVLEEESVTRAAGRLGVSQSAVSHTLDKLRVVFGDPLFVRAGRGIEPTAKAQSLRKSIESILDDLKTLTYEREFDPRSEPLEFTIATNDFPLQLIFPKLLRELSEERIYPRMRFIPSGVPSVRSLRMSRCQMLITPAPPKDPDIEMTQLLQSRMACFFDAAVGSPPKTLKQYEGRNYVDVKFSDTESSSMVLPSLDFFALKPPVVTVPNFSALTSMVKGTDRITTQLRIMKLGLLKDLDVAPLPFETDPLDLFLAWHRRDTDNPAHRWLRERILMTINSIIRD